jgi:predicted phosphodiesterase
MFNFLCPNNVFLFAIKNGFFLMFFAVIGDIMSNFSGLRAVLTLLEEEGIQRVIQTGNICGSGPDSAKCLALLREKNVFCVQGKKDRGLFKLRRRGLQPREESALTFLDSASIEYLNNLPRKRIFTEEGLRILVCHGSVNSPGTMLDGSTPLMFLQRQREEEPADIIISGGGLDPACRLVDNTLFVMPGVMTTTSGEARYILVNTEVSPPSAETITLSGASYT